MTDRIRVRRRRTVLCAAVCPDKCTRHLLPEWQVILAGYRAAPGLYVPELRVSHSTHAAALAEACALTDHVRVATQTVIAIVGETP